MMTLPLRRPPRRVQTVKVPSNAPIVAKERLSIVFLPFAYRCTGVDGGHRVIDRLMKGPCVPFPEKLRQLALREASPEDGARLIVSGPLRHQAGQARQVPPVRSSQKLSCAAKLSPGGGDPGGVLQRCRRY